jgi:ribulose-5-phosphate 4-epimerase/fuculose-1-phosphate aldolase
MRRDVRDTSDVRAARVELACAYRLFAVLGWHELIYNHISLRVPGRHDRFLINPFGLMYREITASSLVEIDINGRAVDPAGAEVNPAGFVVHAAVHRARPDATCVMHTHTTAGMAVACQRDGLLPLSFPSMFYFGRIGYHDFEGITLDTDECSRLARSLGGFNAMILRNHGLLACGPSVADAFAELYHLQRACEVQISAQSAGVPLTYPSEDVALRAATQFDKTARLGSQNQLLFSAMSRWMDATDPSYAE